MRYLLNALSTLSLVLFLSSLFFWHRSYDVRDELSSQSRGVQRMWSSDSGRIGFGLFTISPDNRNDFALTWNHNMRAGFSAPLAGGKYGQHQHFGVGWDVRGSIPFTIGGIRYLQSAREWWMAYWLAVLLAMPLSTIVVWRIARWTALRARLAAQRRRGRARGFSLDVPPGNTSACQQSEDVGSRAIARRWSEARRYNSLVFERRAHAAAAQRDCVMELQKPFSPYIPKTRAKRFLVFAVIVSFVALGPLGLFVVLRRWRRVA